MAKILSKIVSGLSITSVIGLYCLTLAPSALAKGGGGNPNKDTTTTTTTSNTSGTTSSPGNSNKNQTTTTTTTTTTTSTTSSSNVACNVSDVKIGSTSATACKGPFSGNDTGAGNPLLTQLQNGLFDLGSDVTWELAGKSDSNEKNLFGFEAQNDSNIGSWSLDKALGSGPSTFVISLKSSTYYSAYLFKDIDFSKTGLEGIFNTIGVALSGNGSQGKDLSHASIFKATYAKLPEPPKAKVPEPSTSIGLGLVMGGMFIARRRKSN